MKQNKLRQVNQINKNESYYPQLVLKLLDESITSQNNITLYGTKIFRETWGENTLIPLYDNEDGVCGIVYNDVPYYFLKNLQGDIIAIANARGEVEARYSYDAWGVPTVTLDASDCQIATINPYRYRGYYYDAEIGLYYVLSRYYDSEIGRFINTDNCVCLGTGEFALNYNLFSYCLNNPANMSDASGEIPVWVVYAVAGAALFGGVTYVIGKALGITGKALTILTAALAAVGATAAAILGVKFLAKVSPKLAKWAQTVAKNTKGLKPSYKHSSNQKTSLGGLILFDAFKIMLHPPHNNQHNYFHIQIEVKLPGIKMPWIKFRIKINPTKWIS